MKPLILSMILMGTYDYGHDQIQTPNGSQKHLIIFVDYIPTYNQFQKLKKYNIICHTKPNKMFPDRGTIICRYDQWDNLVHEIARHNGLDWKWIQHYTANRWY